MRATFSCLCLLLTLSAWPPAPLSAQETTEFPATPPLVDLGDGSVFVFLGDSITHQALYTQYIETFFLTRYPARDIRFHNAGVSGDRAADALRRFDRDVAHHQPDHVSVLLGMNDAGYTAWNQAVFETYAADMTTLLDRLRDLGAGVTLMHPTMFDVRAARMRGRVGEPTGSRYNGALAYYGEWCREMAWQRGLGFADLHGPLNRLTFAQRRVDPRFTLIEDAVHPGPDGQVVMAVAMLDEVFKRAPLVGNLTLESLPDGGHRLLAPGAEVTDFSEDAATRKITFTATLGALPWVLPEDARLGYQMTRAGHRHSGERFTAQGLMPGDWELLIDGIPVGVWPHGRLARGIELQENDQTPQYRQALAVALGNAERNAAHVQTLRGWWTQKKTREIQLAQAASADPADTGGIARRETSHSQWLKTEFEPGIAAAETRAAEAWQQLRENARPRPHRYELRPATSGAGAGDTVGNEN